MSIETEIGKVFSEDLLNTVAGLEYVFLVDLYTAEVILSYPEAESISDAFIPEIVGTTTVQIEQKAKAVRMATRLSLASMELRTEDGRRIATYRITESLLICLVGKEDTFKPAFAKRLCEGPIKDKINDLLVKYNIAG